jgi:hypothetical protein
MPNYGNKEYTKPISVTHFSEIGKDNGVLQITTFQYGK